MQEVAEAAEEDESERETALLHIKLSKMETSLRAAEQHMTRAASQKLVAKESEVEELQVSIRERSGENLDPMSLDAVVQMMILPVLIVVWAMTVLVIAGVVAA